MYLDKNFKMSNWDKNNIFFCKIKTWELTKKSVSAEEKRKNTKLFIVVIQLPNKKVLNQILMNILKIKF